MARNEDQGTKDDNVVRFDFRDKLKKQRDKRRRKEWMLGLGAFSIRFCWRDAGIELADVRFDLDRILRTCT